MDTQSRNLTVPRGKVFFARYKTGTQIPGPMRELGNCPEFTLTLAADKLDHYSSQSGLKEQDASIPITSSLSGAVTTDDIKAENVALFFMGSVSTLAQDALVGESESFEEVAAGDYYQLGRSDSNPGGHRKVSNVVVTDTDTPATTYVLNDDYTVDADLGLIMIVEGGDAAGMNIDVAYDVAASSREQIISGNAVVEGELKFVSDNPYGAQGDITLPRAAISPNGDFQLVNDPESTAFQTMPLTITALKKGSLALAYRDGRAVTA